MTENDSKRCRCGFTIEDPMITPKARYNKMGYAILSIAFSAKPVEIIFQCQNCGDILKRSKEYDIIEKFRYNSDIFKE
jgi:hypothetical protein